ncbi:MAG: UDP-2,3-diacylglucosamine diphosphatase [Rhodocyclaceae bacterium]|nr:UDP-2,3-diacylglucosamine diphosphatase [Rhodocyclaceae bacterium]
MAKTGARPTLFVSDIHLSAHDAELTELFLSFLAGPARSAASLIILGDLFDAWAGDDDLAAPFNAGIARALRALAESGTDVALMHGNRDFLIGDDFARAAGVTLLPDPSVREIAGQRVLLSHGDGFCTNDLDYQRFRAEIRKPSWKEAFLHKPLSERKQMIAKLRAQSEYEKKKKRAATMDVSLASVCEACCTYRATILVHGHIHRAGRFHHVCHESECTRWVLGAWSSSQGSVLAADDQGWRWLSTSP